MDCVRSLKAPDAEERLRALDSLAGNPEEAFAAVDELLDLLQEPLGACSHLGGLSQGQPEIIGRVLAEVALRKAIERALVAAVSIEGGLDRICRKASKLNDQGIRALYALPPTRIRDWICEKLGAPDASNRRQASELLQAVSGDYSGRIALGKGPLARVSSKPPARPEILSEVSKSGLTLILDRIQHDPEWLIRAQLVRTLGCLDARTDIVSTLSAAISDPEQSVRAAALSALADLGEGAAAAVPAITEALGSAEDLTAAKALRAIGTKAKAALPALKAWVKRGDQAAKEVGKEAISRISGR